MRRPLIAGNWKMHKTPSEALSWLGDFLDGLASTPHAGVDVLLAVPATHLAALAARAKGSDVTLGGQDVSPHDEGAYTGEVSAAMLADAGASHVVVGHSERRAYHDETDQLVAAKLSAARRHGLVPILCIGEREEQRDEGRAEEVVLGQLRAALGGLPLDGPDELVIAYEPVWAIGTGRTATADDAQAMSAAIRAALREDRPDLADGLRILYGGSMKPGNAGDLLARADVDGGLIGGASLDVASLLKIVEAAA
ncbi:MAG: triose-phosphate isomerase [Deinococcus-Thermus bacterium]|jgi:triosephosphate isomerase|nr:triose-phosphate isomerase [Deinococcota bacterium]